MKERACFPYALSHQSDGVTCYLYVLTVFCILLGELPTSIIKMKTDGVDIKLSGNIGFTLPLNMGELANIERLNLSYCSLTGKYSYMEEQACFPYAISYQSDRVTCFLYVLTDVCILQVPYRLNWANWRI